MVESFDWRNSVERCLKSPHEPACMQNGQSSHTQRPSQEEESEEAGSNREATAEGGRASDHDSKAQEAKLRPEEVLSPTTQWRPGNDCLHPVRRSHSTRTSRRSSRRREASGRTWSETESYPRKIRLWSSCKVVLSVVPCSCIFALQGIFYALVPQHVQVSNLSFNVQKCTKCVHEIWERLFCIGSFPRLELCVCSKFLNIEQGTSS